MIAIRKNRLIKNSFKISVKNLAITEKYLHLCNAKTKNATHTTSYRIKKLV
jgi:hypothetical protein